MGAERASSARAPMGIGPDRTPSRRLIRTYASERGRRGLSPFLFRRGRRGRILAMKPQPIVRLTPGKRVLFLTKDAELIRRQLRGELDLQMSDLDPSDLLDDINTDVMTPAWVCFNWQPEEIAREAYAGLIVDGQRLFERDALANGNFEVIVSGLRKGTGSSRETAAQCEKYAGIRIAIAASFAPIHARNNLNLGTLMGDYDVLARLQTGRRRSARRVHRGLRPDHPADHRVGRPVPVLEGARRWRGEAAGARHAAPADDHGREDPGAPCRRYSRRYAGRGDLREAGRRRRGRGRRRLHPRVHHRAGACLSGRGVRRGLQDPGSRALRGLRGSSDLRRRGRADAPLPAQDRDPARHAARVPASHRRARLLVHRRRLARHLSRARAHAHGRAGRLHPGDRFAHLHGRREQRPHLGRGSDRVRGPHPLGLHPGRGPGVDPLRAHREAAAERHGQGPDAPHPARLRAAAGDAQPGHGVHRPGRLHAVDGRARDARQHGDRVHRQERHRLGRRGDLPLARRRGARESTGTGCARAPSSPMPTRSTPAAFTSSISRRSRRWWPTRAIPTAASPRTRPTGRRSPRSARSGSTSPTAAAAPPARSTTSSSITAS